MKNEKIILTFDTIVQIRQSFKYDKQRILDYIQEEHTPSFDEEYWRDRIADIEKAEKEFDSKALGLLDKNSMPNKK